MGIIQKAEISSTQLSSKNTFHSIAGDGIEEEQKEDGKEGDNDHLDDGPLVVVPDDVLDGLEGVQEPHKGGVRTTVKENHEIRHLQVYK